MKVVRNRPPMKLSKDQETFFVAITYSKLRIFEHMLDSLASLDFFNSEGHTPLTHAVIIAPHDVCAHFTRLLLKKNANVNAQDAAGRTALMYACMLEENVDVVKILTRSGRCNVNVQDDEGNTALIYGVAANNLSAVRFIVHMHVVEPLVNVNLRNVEGKSALDVAVNLELVDCIDVLVREALADASEHHDNHHVKKAMNMLKRQKDEKAIEEES